jgi:hypothetical protein
MRGRWFCERSDAIARDETKRNERTSRDAIAVSVERQAQFVALVFATAKSKKDVPRFAFSFFESYCHDFRKATKMKIEDIGADRMCFNLVGGIWERELPISGRTICTWNNVDIHSVQIVIAARNHRRVA